MMICKQYNNAERLVKDLGITEPAEIDIEAIAYYCGAKIRYRELTGCEASIVGADQHAIITVNSRSRLERQRFSIGHELGHWMLDRGRESFGKWCQQKDIGAQWSFRTDPEARANAFSADLLMPGYLFAPQALNRPMIFETVIAISSLFQTSLTATAIRLVKFGSYPAMLVCHSKKRREWFVPGPDLPDDFYPHQVLDSDSEAFDIINGAKGDMSEPTETSADIWIDKKNAEDYDLIEQSIKISDNLVLTVLWWKNEAQIIDAADD